MTGFMQRTAKHFLVIKAAREIKEEIEKAGVDNLKILADAGHSIVGTYLNGCSPQEKERIRRDLNTLLKMGITTDAILEEVTRQMQEIVPIIAERVDYKRSEIAQLTSFLKTG